jgi:valyl-tRNA synthetase
MPRVSVRRTGSGRALQVAAPPATSAVNRWIIGEVVETLAELDKAMADLRFDAAANAIYQFSWDTFCDWYLELIKGQIDDETKAVAGWVLDQILVMLHPFMPFVTEELWHAQGERPYELIVAKWPKPQAAVDAAAKAEVEWLIALTSAIRGAKNELGLAPGAKLEAFLAAPSATARSVIEGNAAALDRLARFSAIRHEPAPAGAAMQLSAGSDLFVIPLEGLIDVAAEKPASPRRAKPRSRSATPSPSASTTPRSSRRPGPRQSTRPAPTTRTMPPRPSGSRRRWRGWAEIAALAPSPLSDEGNWLGQIDRGPPLQSGPHVTT